MKISVIIPVFNEKTTIESLLEQLEKIKNDCEIIFVDGGSTDGTTEKIPESMKLVNSPKGRAEQMNEGARISSGEVLFFLHCDSFIPEDALNQIEDVMKSYRAGCFGISFIGAGFLMKCCGHLSNLRVKLWKIAFGDQGIFIERDLFFEIGGFPKLPLMEDYQFSLNLREKKIDIGMTRDKIYTSDRRYAKGGVIRTMWRMHSLRRKYRKGEDIEKIAALYKDIR